MTYPVERFWEKVDQSGDCWLWMGGRNDDGYGIVQWEGHVTGAHRVAYEISVGPIPEGKLVLHSCDNPSCVNPNHLWIGDQSDNAADSVAKGRKGKRGIREIKRYRMTYRASDEILLLCRRLAISHVLRQACLQAGVLSAYRSIMRHVYRPSKRMHYRTYKALMTLVGNAQEIELATTEEMRSGAQMHTQLAAFLSERNMSQAELARQLAYSPDLINLVLRGHRKPSGTLRWKFANVYGLAAALAVFGQNGQPPARTQEDPHVTA